VAHSALHFSFGMIVAAAFSLPPLLRRWRRNGTLARHFRSWLLFSYGLGIYATVPGILRRLGIPDAVCDGWWMNLFLLYPLINIVKPGAMTMGPLVLGFCFAAQYSLLFMAVRRLTRRKGGGSGSSVL